MTGNKKLRRQTLFSLAVFLFIFILATTLWRTFAWAETPTTALTLSDIKAELLPTGSIIISWKTNKPADATVVYSYDLSFNQTKILSTPYLERVIILDNIKSDTLYHYRVISRTAEGEEARSLHLMVQSHRPVDLTVSRIDIDPVFQLYDGQPPLLDKGSFTAAIRNNGDIDWAEDFYASVLITHDDSVMAAGEEMLKPYSCFVEKKIVGGISAQKEIDISLNARDMASCEPLASGKYLLTVAADYDDRVDDIKRENNTMTVALPAIGADSAPQFYDLDALSVTDSSADISVSLDRQDPLTRVIVEYSPQNYFESEATPGMYLYEQDASFDQGVFVAEVKGLAQEAIYHLRVRLAGTNVVSADITFMTKKNPQADAERLLAMKRIDPTCRIVDHQPTRDNYWQDLGLSLPQPQPILRYRLQWLAGNWSPWYIPGFGDEDWQLNLQGQERRVWSYFQDHNFQYETCGDGALPSRLKSADTADKEKYGGIIDRRLESKSKVLTNKIAAFDTALKYYKRAVSVGNWQILRDAYVYGGYSLAEITDTIARGPGAVHPSIPAQVWRRQYRIQLSSNNN